MTSDAKPRLTLREAFDDLGWFYGLFAAVVGGPSALEILVMIFELRLVDALQWIVDGYRFVTALLAGYIEPFLQPAIAWLNETFDWRLQLHPHWRPVFTLSMVFVIGLVRMVQRESGFEAVLFGLLLSAGALLGAVTVGVFSLEGGWSAQGLAAATPVALVSFLLGMPLAITTAGGPRARPDPLRSLVEVAVLALLLAGVTFGLAAGLSFAPGLAKGAGIAALAICLLAIGFVSLLAGFDQADRLTTRIGLTLIGGFAVAALIVAVDAILKLIG